MFDQDFGHLCSWKTFPYPKHSVKSTSPDTENHDKNGYVKLYDDKNFIMTNVDNSDTTCTKHELHEQARHLRPATSEHCSALLVVVLLVDLVSHHIGSSRP